MAPAVRDFMEERFRHDFARIRIHADDEAAASAQQVDARAYTVGNHIVFGRSAYAPSTPRGRALLAHELAHVVQQGGMSPSAQGPITVGSPSDPAEHEAGIAARTVGGGQATAPVITRRQSGPVLQREPTAETWAGTYHADEYSIQQGEDNTEVNGCRIKLRFEPNQRVNATKITFVQTADSRVDGKPYNKYTDTKKQEATALSRAIPAGQPGAGTHIDQAPGQTTPLYSHASPSGSKELAKSTPNPKFVKVGFATGKGADFKKDDPFMIDDPNLVQPKDKDASQTFESAAIAVEGDQKGVLYGSVTWGWFKKPGKDIADGLPLKAVAGGPSKIFGAAASRWNLSVSSSDEKSIPAPTAQGFRVQKPTSLLATQGKTADKIASLVKGTQLQLQDRLEGPQPPAWLFVIVTSGPSVGKMGWVSAGDVKMD